MQIATLTDRTLTVVIPVLNEADGLAELCKRLPRVLGRLTTNWHILFVDDGSTDATLPRIKSLAIINPRIQAISLSRNFGKEIAIAAGLSYAKSDAVIIMDADLQHPPEVLEAFVKRWLEGYEVVYGQRIDRQLDNPIRRILSRLFYRTYNALVETDIPEGAGDFRLLNRNAIESMNTITERSRFNKGLYSWIGFKSIGVPYTVAERKYGHSKWRFGKLVSFAIDGLTSFTTLPLRVWSLIGIVISFVSLSYAMYFLIRTTLFGADLPGYASLIVSVMFFSGIQLISLGVLGQYIGRIYEEVKSRPLFIVAEEIGTLTTDNSNNTSSSPTAASQPTLVS